MLDYTVPFQSTDLLIFEYYWNEPMELECVISITHSVLVAWAVLGKLLWNCSLTSYKLLVY